MATRTKWGRLKGARPDPAATEAIWKPPFSVHATNDVWKFGVWTFGALGASPTTRLLLHHSFMVPDDYVGTPLWVIDWTSGVISGDRVWDFQFRTVGGDDTTSYDQAGTERSLTVTDTAPSAAWERMEVTIALTAGDFTAGERVEFAFGCDGADAADTMAAAPGICVDCGFRYNNA